MTNENEWVKLPDQATRLPEGTLIQLCSWVKPPLFWAVTVELSAFSEGGSSPISYRGRAAAPSNPSEEFVVSSSNISRVKLPPGYRFEGSEVVNETDTVDCTAGCDGAGRVWHDSGSIPCRVCNGTRRVPNADLGDTPEHLRELLRAAREKVPGTVICEWEERHLLFPPTGVGCFVALDESVEKEVGRYVGNIKPATCERAGLRDSILLSRCHPTIDARRIGREEFGMVFEGDAPKWRPAAGELITGTRYSSGDSGSGRFAYFHNGFAILEEGEALIAATIRPAPSERSDIDITLSVDARPLCLSCKSAMDERSDGSRLCSPACLQAAQRKERDRAAKERHEASDKVYAAQRQREEEKGRHGIFRSDPLDMRIGDVQGLGPLLSDTLLPRSDSRTWSPLNPAALPGVAGIRGKRRTKTDAPTAWPEGAGDDYEL
jgi:hypothetical protein